jgi:hypothetical protein
MAGKTEPAAKAKTPRGWYMAGSEPTHYESGIDSSLAHSGSRCAYVHPAVDDPQGFGTMMQCFASHSFLGKRVKMSVWMKTEKVEDWAAAFLRVDSEGGGRMLSIDNMCNRQISGTTDWKKYEIVLDVSHGSSNICFGAMLSGKGKIWVDDVSFEPVGADVQVTDCPCLSKEKRSEPRNLNFEEKDTDN